MTDREKQAVKLNNILLTITEALRPIGVLYKGDERFIRQSMLIFAAMLMPNSLTKKQAFLDLCDGAFDTAEKLNERAAQNEKK